MSPDYTCEECGKVAGEREVEGWWYVGTAIPPHGLLRERDVPRFARGSWMYCSVECLLAGAPKLQPVKW